MTFRPHLGTDKAALVSLLLLRETGGELGDTLRRLRAVRMPYRDIADKLHAWTGVRVSFRTVKNWCDAANAELETAA